MLTLRHRGRPKPSAALAAAVSLAFAATGAVSAAAPAAADADVSIGPIHIGTRQAPLVLPVNAGRNADLQLRVNGHAPPASFDFVGRRLQIAHLSASDGLVPGVNRLRVRDFDSAATRRVRIPRHALLADAGPDSGATVAAVSQIGAEPAGPAAAPGLLRKWRIVSKPPGASVTLQHRHRAQPLLSARTPGTYVMRLRARLKGSHRASYDTVTEPISPDDLPIGMPFSSLEYPTGAIVIDGESYGSDPAKDMHYAVIERASGSVVESDSVSSSTGGIATLSDVAQKYGAGDSQSMQDYLMVVNGLRGLRGLSADQQAAFTNLAHELGAAVTSPDDFKSLTEGDPFSIVGIPGAPLGAATVRFPPYGFGDPGAITGYLQKNQAIQIDGAHPYEYVSDEYPAYDTGVPQSDRNEMTVGGDHYGVSLSDSGISGATAGFHVVILDSQTLELRENSVLVTNAADAGRDRELQGAVAGFLRDKFALYGQPTVLLQTIGKPKAAGPEWQGIVNALARLGANRQLVNALDGTTQYAIVGRFDSDKPPAEASTAFDHGPYPAPHYPPARLVGVLARTHASTFEPLMTNVPTAKSPDGGMHADLFEIAYQPSQDWPDLGKPGDPADEVSAAEQWICKDLKFCKPTDSCPDMRSCYWQKSSSTWQSTGVDTTYPGSGHGFSETVFDHVKAELKTEVNALHRVDDYLRDLVVPITQTQLASWVDLQGISDVVWKSVQKPVATTGASGFDYLNAIASVFGAVQVADVATAGAGLSAALAFAGLFSDQHGEPILGDDIQAKSDALGQRLLARVNLAISEMSGLRLLLVSDYGKLMDTLDHVAGDWSLPDNAATTGEQLRLASNQWFYEELVPVAYPYLLRGNAPNARALNCQISDARAFPNQPDDAQMQATVGYDASGQPIKNVFFFTRGMLGASSPPAGLADTIFRRTSGGLGVEKLSFFTPQVFNGSINHAVNGRSYCNLPWLPRFP